MSTILCWQLCSFLSHETLIPCAWCFLQQLTTPCWSNTIKWTYGIPLKTKTFHLAYGFANRCSLHQIHALHTIKQCQKSMLFFSRKPQRGGGEPSVFKANSYVWSCAEEVRKHRLHIDPLVVLNMSPFDSFLQLATWVNKRNDSHHSSSKKMGGSFTCLGRNMVKSLPPNMNKLIGLCCESAVSICQNY